ncbi:O-antigen ligase family protein [bacterium]|nr:O-antigen ligase family protein [bacterium]
MMDILFYLFQKPMVYAIGYATAAFVVFYFLSRTRQGLANVVFVWILVEIVFVSLHFTARLNNIVILKDISYQVINFGLLLLWISHLPEKDGFKFTPTPMNIAVFGFFVACVITTYTAPRIFWYYAVEWASRFGASIAIFFLIVQFSNTRFRWNITLYTLLAMMVVSSIYGIMQVRGYDFMTWGRVVNVSTFGNKDFFASFLTYTAPIALFMAFGARNIFDGLLYLAMAWTGLYNMWTGETRGAWVGMMALAGVWFIFECRFGRLQRLLGSWKKQAVFWSALLVLTVVLTPVLMSPHRLETFRSIFQFHKGTNIIRVYMWWTGGRMWWDAPILGQGLGASHVTYPFYRPDRYHRIGMSHNTDYVHSEELQFLCEQGIVGFSAWLAMIGVFFYICYRKLRTLGDVTERYTLFGIAGAFFAAVVHDSMNVNLRWTGSMIAFWTVLALGTRYAIGFDPPSDSRIVQKETRRRGLRRDYIAFSYKTWILFPVVTAAFAFMFYGQYRVLRGDWALKNTEDGSGPPATASGHDTLKYNPYSHSAYYKVAYHYLNESNLKDALKMYEGLLTIAPNYAQTHQNTGLVYYRFYGNSGQRKYLYQSVLEFEWATILENNFDNHTKLLQLWTQLLSHSGRARYHNQYIAWNSLEDAVHNLWLFYVNHWNMPNAAQATKDHLYDVYMKPIDESRKAYWLYRTDTVRRVGRPKEEIRYAMKMSTRFEHANINLLQYGINSLLVDQVQTAEDMLFLISIIESMDPREVPPALFYQGLQTLRERVIPSNYEAIGAYAMGVLSHKLGDLSGARNHFQIAQGLGASRYEFIREGVKKYGI